MADKYKGMTQQYVSLVNSCKSDPEWVRTYIDQGLRPRGLAYWLGMTARKEGLSPQEAADWLLTDVGKTSLIRHAEDLLAPYGR